MLLTHLPVVMSKVGSVIDGFRLGNLDAVITTAMHKLPDVAHLNALIYQVHVGWLPSDLTSLWLKSATRELQLPGNPDLITWAADEQLFITPAGGPLLTTGVNIASTRRLYSTGAWTPISNVKGIDSSSVYKDINTAKAICDTTVASAILWILHYAPPRGYV